MQSLAISSCMAPNMDFLCPDLADFIEGHLSIPVEPVIEISWQEREQGLDSGTIDLCWICGLWYVRKADRYPGKLEPLVAPVMAASRYQNRPIYFSDVVVHRDSPFYNLADLRGASWAYNEPRSHSGHGVVCYSLAQRGESLGMFARVVESGSHQASITMILGREVDATAIDSTVLERELANHPEIEDQIRIIDTFGPSPIPPWVILTRVPLELRKSLRKLLTQMGSDPSGQAILENAGMAHFDPVSDRDYDPIRRMAQATFGS